MLEGGRSRNKALAKIDFREHSLECGGRSQKIILIQFSYFSGETTLSEIIATRIAQLNSFKSSKSPNLALELEEVKLCDYEEIDSLDYTQRQYINIFYQ